MIVSVTENVNHSDDDDDDDDDDVVNGELNWDNMNKERNVQISKWDGIALDRLASRDIPQLIEQVGFLLILAIIFFLSFSATMLR